MADREKRHEQDSFWDVSKLIPPRKGGRLSRFSSDPPLAPVTAPAEDGTSGDAQAEERRLTVSPSAATEAHTYTPVGNPLLRSVTVRRTVGGYGFYEQFRRDAARYFEKNGSETAYVPFFSFMPQYNQLSEEQLAYYLFWRGEVRSGRYPPTDKGYLFLLIYEIINLPEQIPPAEGAQLLSALWDAYRERIPGIDRFLSLWITDYCLLWELPAPPLSSLCLAAASEGDGVEFFFGNAAEATEEGILRLLSICSAYRYELSHAVTDENRALFTSHIVGAMSTVLPALFRMGLIGRGEAPTRIRRRAFVGALCTGQLRAELEYEYISLRRSEGLRHTVGLSVKYAENRLRAALGIRARLSTTGLMPELRALIDAYFAKVSGALVPRRAAPPPPAYERLYDAPEAGIDRASAAAIENASWELTRRLVLEEEEEVPPAAPVPIPEAADPSAPCTTECGEGLAAFLAGGEAPRAAAARFGMPLALLAERVNELFLPLIGDVLVEPDGDDFVLIEDYREEAEAWLTNNKG